MCKVVFLVFTVTLILCFFVCTIDGRSADASALLDRDSWSFSDEEIRNLNALKPIELESKLASIIRGITVGLEVGKLMQFKFVDLNDDGIVEMIVRCDLSGRGLTRDISVLSQKTGKQYYEMVPCYGRIVLWKTENRKLIVGSEPVFELFGCDPILAFSQLYAWTGATCKDVSKQYWPYYRDQILPLLTNRIFEIKNTNFRSLESEPKHRLTVSAVNCALTADKLKEMFPELLAVRDLTKKIYDLLNALRLDDNEHPVLIKKFRNVQERTRLRIGVSPTNNIAANYPAVRFYTGGN